MRIPLLISGLVVAMVAFAVIAVPTTRTSSTGSATGRRLRGVIREERKLTPIAGADIVVFDAASKAELGRAVSDADGFYEIAPFPEAEVKVIVATEEFAPYVAAKDLVTVGGPEVTVLEAQLPDIPAASMRARVIDFQTGLPMKGVELVVGARAPVLTDAEGDATVSGLDVGLQTVEFRRPGLPTTSTSVETNRKRITNSTFALEEKAVTVRGTLVDGRLGTPLPNRTIQFVQHGHRARPSHHRDRRERRHQEEVLVHRGRDADRDHRVTVMW